MDTTSLHNMAQKLRLEAVRMVYEGKDGHPGPALSIADIVADLFFQEMNLDPANPNWEDRDRFILSKGHACPIYYAALNEKGYFQPKVDMRTGALFGEEALVRGVGDDGSIIPPAQFIDTLEELPALLGL